MWMCINVFIDLQKCSSMVPLYVVAIASYHRGAHLMKPQSGKILDKPFSCFNEA